jgi:DNA-binding transcriptional LysR family regulator
MDLRKLRHAATLAETGSFSAASERLAITQSALSRSIQALEADLGQTLFDRSTKGVRLTAAGALLIPRARSLLRQANEIERDAAQLASGEAGRVAIGFGPMFSHLPAELIEHCWTEAPDVELQTHILPIERMTEMVLREELDFFVADSRSAEAHAELAIEPLAELPVGYHVRSGHPLADGKAHEATELRAYPLASPNLRQQGGVSAASGWTGHVACELLDPLRDLVKDSDAVLLAMHFAVAGDLDAGRLVTLDVRGYENWRSQVALVRLADRALTPVARKYCEATRSLFGPIAAATASGD